MIDPELETSLKGNEEKLKKETLSEFITLEVSSICMQYLENTGKKPSQDMIKSITFMLYNAYHKQEILDIK